ncbi:DUF4198 domain-containing protein [Tateyamaria armeniaca]|uniref:DUF4198 domain-containing protein n=1 Tax=Tateyamaria armeniaca TaxID=2518930 RepID=A0ABW8UWT8_9RHOB
MFRPIRLALAGLVVTHAAHAHEFWIEPTVSGTQVTVEVHVGEHFEGEVFPFEPRAYETALWVGPETRQALHTRPLAQRDLSLAAQGEGLHVLAIASFGQTLRHPSLQDFKEFADSIGANHVLREIPPVADEDGRLRETYRRFSKTLVHFGERRDEDRRLGLQYEWVQGSDGFTLYSGGTPAAHHPVDVFCRQADMQVRESRLRTDDTGNVAPSVKPAERCLINAVFLRPHEDGRRWSSDWVSLLWDS